MELRDSTTQVLLVLTYSVKIEPGGQRTVPLECTRKITGQMDIRIDTGFHHRNPNVHIPPSYVDNPWNVFDSKYIPLTIFNLSHVDYLYIGRDTVAAFADKLTVDVYNVEIASDGKIKDTKPSQEAGCHNITKHYQRYLVTLLLYVHLQMYQATARSISRARKSQGMHARGLKNCEEYGEAFSKHN